MTATAGPDRAAVAVVGLGLIGAACVRHLADGGVAVVGIGPPEPADLATHRGVFGSHYDSGRITRRLDPVAEWAELADRSINEYPALAAAGGTAFHHPVGVVMAELDPTRIAAIERVAADRGLDVTVERPVDAAPRPWSDGRLSLPASSTVFSEPAPAGYIDPRRMLAAQLAAATAAGAAIVPEAASGVERSSSGWRIRVGDGRDTPSVEIGADRVVVAAGAHSDELAGLPFAPAFQVRAEAVVIATLDDAEAARLVGIPSVLARLADHPAYADLYLVPPTRYPDGTIGLKMGATLHHRPELADGAARRAWMAGDGHRSEAGDLSALLRSLVPGLRAVRWDTKPCLITDTPSGRPMVGEIAPGLVLAAGGNGYAAKSADAIGALAAGLVRHGRWTDPTLDAAAFEPVARA